MRIDWDDGDYERVGRVLTPAAAALVEATGIGPGGRLLDVACGTGSAAFAATARGAHAVGVDEAEGLLAPARRRADREGAPVEFLVGDLHRLPVPDGAFDATVSSFGAIFADDPARAVAEMLRATRPGGVVALSTWLSDGAIGAAGRVLRGAFPAPPGPAPRWDDPAWVRALLEAEGGRDVRAEPAGTVVFTAASPAAWLAEQVERHPVWRFARRELDPSAWDEAAAGMLAVLESGNEDPGAFRATSRYMIALARR